MNLANTSSGRQEGFRPNPKLKLREQVREVWRFRHASLRTEVAYGHWIKGFLVFLGGSLVNWLIFSG
jgi:hypothetical protein